MSNQPSTGLGEPEPIGKKNLFQPPKTSKAITKRPEAVKFISKPARISMTLEITKKSLAILQDVQSKYRLETGRLLPKWKVISAALEAYEKMQKGEGSDKTK